MAAAIQQGKTGKKVWYAVFRIGGKQKWVKLGAVTKELTKAKAKRLADVYQRAAEGKESAQNIRASLESVLQSVYGNDEARSSTVKEFCQSWLSRNQPASIASKLAYGNTVERFLTFLGSKGNQGISRLKRADLEAFREHAREGRAPSTTNRHVQILKAIFKDAHKDGYTPEDIGLYVDKVKSARSASRRRPFTVSELEAVLEHADPEWQSLIRFGLYTGQRLGDLASLTWSNIDLARNEIRLVTKKNGTRMTIPIAPTLLDHILTLPSSDRPGTPIHPRAYEVLRTHQGRAGLLSNWFVDLLHDAGLRERVNHGAKKGVSRASSEISFHCLRHTYVSMFKDAGVSQATALALTGHSSATISALYTHVDPESLRRGVASLPRI
jgi:integrase